MKRTIARLTIPVAAATVLLCVACGGKDSASTNVGSGEFSAASFGVGPRVPTVAGQPAADQRAAADLAKEIIKETGKAGAKDAPKVDTKAAGDVAKAIEQASKTGDAAKLDDALKSAERIAQSTRDNTTKGPGSCEMKVSGDVTKTIKSGGGSGAVGTDYWITDDEMRTSLKAIAQLTGKKSDAELEREIAAAMKEDPRFMLLILNCGSSAGTEGSLSLMPGGDSKYANVPFGPKTYAIAKGGLLGGGAKAGEFTAMFTLGDDFYGIDEPGELKVTKFDKSGIAGTFSFKASERLSDTAKKVTVQGTFDFPCAGGGICKK